MVGTALFVFNICWRLSIFGLEVVVFDIHWASLSSNCKTNEKNPSYSVDRSLHWSSFHLFAEKTGKNYMAVSHLPERVWVYLMNKFGKYWDWGWSVCKDVDWTGWIGQSMPASLRVPQELHYCWLTQQVEDGLFCLEGRGEDAVEPNFSPTVEQHLCRTDPARFLAKGLESSNRIEQIVQ